MFNKFLTAAMLSLALTAAVQAAQAPVPIVIKITPKVCAAAYEYAYGISGEYNQHPNREQKVLLGYVMDVITQDIKKLDKAGQVYASAEKREELRGVGFLRDQVAVLKVYMDNGVSSEEAQRSVARNMFNLCLNTNSYVFEPIEQPKAPVKAKVKGASI